MVVKINAWGDVAKKCAIVDEKMDIQVLHVQPGPVRNNSQEYKHELELRMTKDSEIKLLEEENACSIRTYVQVHLFIYFVVSLSKRYCKEMWPTLKRFVCADTSPR